MDPRDAATWPEVMSPEEVAIALGMNPGVVRRLLAAGDLPGRKVGRLWMTTKSRLLTYLNTGEGI